MCYLIEKYAPFPEGEGPQPIPDADMTPFPAENNHCLVTPAESVCAQATLIRVCENAVEEKYAEQLGSNERIKSKRHDSPFDDMECGW